MHADETYTDVALVRQLLRAQMPQWADLPLARVASSGTDNAIYRLGNEMAVRLPRIDWAVGQADKEHAWLPLLAPQLPLAVPTPLAKGAPGDGYPWTWLVVRWLEGESVTARRLHDLSAAARTLASFVNALQRVDAPGGPPPGPHNSYRGVPLALRDAPTRSAIAALVGEVDTRRVSRAWDAALAAPAWSRPAVWVHGDLHAGNLVAREGRLAGVIDFGCLGIGDPACDAMPGWTLFTGESRRAFRDTLDIDEATWARGRGWVLSWALIALPYYRGTNPLIVRHAESAIAAVLDDAEV